MNLLPSSSWSRNSKGLRGLHSFWGLWGEALSWPFPLLEAACLPRPVAPRHSDSASIIASPSLTLALLTSSHKKPEITWGPLRNPGKSPHFKIVNLITAGKARFDLEGNSVIDSGDSDVYGGRPWYPKLLPHWVLQPKPPPWLHLASPGTLSLSARETSRCSWEQL